MIKRLIIALALGTGILFTANAQNSAVKDSLLRIYVTAPHDSMRLDVLHDIARLDQQTPVFLYYENKLLKEATEQNNLRYQSLATYEHIIYFFNKLDLKRVTQWMNRMEVLAEKHNYYNDYFKAKKLQIEMYTINQQIELAIHEANIMYDKAKKLNDSNGMREACLCLMTSYIATLRYEDGAKALEEAFHLMSPQDRPMDKINLLSKAVLAYSFLHNNEKMYASLEQMKVAIQDLITATPALKNAYSALYMGMETQYALYYVRTGNPKKAWEHLQKADEYDTPNTFLPYRVSRLQAYAEYYRARKEYEKALESLDNAITLTLQMSFPDAILYMAMKADILVDMGHPEVAINIYRKVMRDKDSLYRGLSNAQMEQIQSLYNMDKLVLKREQQQEKIHYFVLIVIGIALLALIAFVIHMYFSRKRLQKDEKEVARLSEIAEEANEVKSRFLANMSYNIRIPLNNVVGFSQLLSTDMGLDDKEKLEYSEIIQANSTDLIQLVNDVLDLSRLEAKMMKFQIQDCEMREICNDLIYMARRDSNGHIHAELESDVEHQMLRMDANRFNQAVLSMLIYPVPNDTDREVKMQLSKDEENQLLTFRIINSPLVDPAFASQQVSIRLKINQLLFEHFGGSFMVSESAEDGYPITFSIATL